MPYSMESQLEYQMSDEQIVKARTLAFDVLEKGGTKAQMIHKIEAEAGNMKVAIMAAMFVGHMVD